MEIPCSAARRIIRPIGESGSRASVVEGFPAQRIVNGEVPGHAEGTKVILRTDMAGLMAPSTAVNSSKPSFWKEAHLCRTAASFSLHRYCIRSEPVSTEGGSDGRRQAEARCAFARGAPCIGAMTLNEYRQYIEKDVAACQKVMIGERPLEATRSPFSAVFAVGEGRSPIRRPDHGPARRDCGCGIELRTAAITDHIFSR